MVLRNGKNNVRLPPFSLSAEVRPAQKSAAMSLKPLDWRTEFRFIPPNEKMNLRRLSSILALLALCGSLAATRAQNPAAFELLNGDRVALLGDTLIEREQSYGHLEFLLTVHYPDRNIT